MRLMDTGLSGLRRGCDGRAKMSSFANSNKVSINNSDITIGAVEIKDAYGSARAVVDTPAHMSESNELLGVQAPVLGIINDSAVLDDSPGTLSAKLRGLLAVMADSTLADSLNLSGNDESIVLSLGGRKYVDIHVLSSNGDHAGTLAIHSTVDGINYDAEVLTNALTGAKSTTVAVTGGVAVDERFLLGPLAATAVKVVYTRSSGGAAQTASVTARARR